MPQTQSVPSVTPASHLRTVLSFIVRKAAIACGYAATFLAMLKRPAVPA